MGINKTSEQHGIMACKHCFKRPDFVCYCLGRMDRCSQSTVRILELFGTVVCIGSVRS